MQFARAFSTLAVAGVVFVAGCENAAAPLPQVSSGKSTRSVAATNAVLNPANGHYYEVVLQSPIDFWTSKAGAEDRAQGTCTSSHLVSITSAAEDAFVYDLMPGGAFWSGGYQTPGSNEPGDGWTWTTGEAFTYYNWRAGEPNNSGYEQAMYIHRGETGTVMVDYNEYGSDLNGYVAEYEGCVVTPEQTIQQTLASVQSFVAAGFLTPSEASSVQAKLDAAANQLAKANKTAAKGQLSATVNALEAKVRSGKIPASAGNPVIAALNTAIASL